MIWSLLHAHAYLNTFHDTRSSHGHWQSGRLLKQSHCPDAPHDRMLKAQGRSGTYICTHADKECMQKHALCIFTPPRVHSLLLRPLHFVPLGVLVNWVVHCSLTKLIRVFPAGWDEPQHHEPPATGTPKRSLGSRYPCMRLPCRDASPRGR